MKGPVYRDFCTICDQRIAVIQSEALNAEDIPALRECKGEIRGLEFWKILPQVMMKEYKSMENKETTDG